MARPAASAGTQVVRLRRTTREVRAPQAHAGASPGLSERVPLVPREWLVQAPHEWPHLSEEVPFDAVAQIVGPSPWDAHIHYGIEVGVLLSGSQRRRFVDDNSFAAVAGDVWLVPLWEPHGWQVTAPDTRAVVLHFLPSFLGAEMLGETFWLSLFAVPPSQRPRVASPDLRKQVLAIGKEMWREVAERRAGWLAMTKADLLRLLTVLGRHWPTEVAGGCSAQADATTLGQVMPAVSVLYSNPGRRLSVADAAKACGLSIRHFERLFARNIGVGFHRFCLRARLAHAERLLATTSLPISTVAEEADFGDTAHLDRAFVTRYRCTPGAFRDRSRRRAVVGEH